ncbi:MAG: hypothetical protein R2741_08315 [Methanolobus sp.]
MADESENFDVYRFWTHFFASDKLKQMLEPEGFWDIEFFDDVLPDIDIWNGKNVLFCKSERLMWTWMPECIYPFLFLKNISGNEAFIKLYFHSNAIINPFSVKYA